MSALLALDAESRCTRSPPTPSRSGASGRCSERGRLRVGWIVLTATLFLIPVAIWLAIRWCLLAPVATLEEDRARDVLRGSRDLVRRRWLRTASLVGLSAAIALLLGPLLGALLIFVVDAPLAVLNLVAGIVYAAALPFVGLVTAYVYFDARTRVELEPVVDERELPAEIELSRA